MLQGVIKKNTHTVAWRIVYWRKCLKSNFFIQNYTDTCCRKNLQVESIANCTKYMNNAPRKVKRFGLMCETTTRDDDTSICKAGITC